MHELEGCIYANRLASYSMLSTVPMTAASVSSGAAAATGETVVLVVVRVGLSGHFVFA